MIYEEIEVSTPPHSEKCVVARGRVVEDVEGGGYLWAPTGARAGVHRVAMGS